MPIRDAQSTDDDSFDRFWRAYPRRQGRKDAQKAWRQVNGAAHIAAILAALEWQRHQESWVKAGGQYIPLGATWLRGERWTDEPITLPQVSEKTLRSMKAIYGD